jgi:catechol 2,3-dioxygenase-like lactoylglutathione lyase family enzyme
MSESVLLHITIGVADLEAAERFYAEVLGFARAPQRFQGDGPDVARISGFGARGESSAHSGIFLRRGGFFLELVRFEAATAGPQRMHLKHYGYQHMCFGVPDLAATLSRVEQHGGRVDAERRLDFKLAPGLSASIVYCHDCAGNVLELIEHRDSRTAAAHAAAFGLEEFGWAAEPAGTS